MKRMICGLLLTCGMLGATENQIPQHRIPPPDGFVFPAKDKELDVYTIGRYDFDGDGIMEQIVIDSGGGTGSPIWHIRRLNGVDLSGDIQGRAWLAKTHNGFPQLIVESQCGCEERHFYLYQFDGEKYACIRHERHDYKENRVFVEPDKSNSKSSNRR